MTEDTKGLVLAALKKIRIRSDLMGERLKRMRHEITAIKGHLGAFSEYIRVQDEQMAQTNLHLRRIERRLELRVQ